MRSYPIVAMVLLAYGVGGTGGCLLTLDPSFPAPDAGGPAAGDVGGADIPTVDASHHGHDAGNDGGGGSDALVPMDGPADAGLDGASDTLPEGDTVTVDDVTMGMDVPVAMDLPGTMDLPVAMDTGMMDTGMMDTGMMDTGMMGMSDAGCPVSVRLVSPLSGTQVSITNPTLRWAFTGPVTLVQVQFLTARPGPVVVGVDGGLDALDGGTFTSDAATVTSDGGATVTGVGSMGGATGATELLQGRTWFWRARAVAPCVSEWSATWQFFVPWVSGRESGHGDTSWGAIPDVNGDGRADLAVGVPADADGTGRVDVYYGGEPGGGVGINTGAAPSVTLTAPPGAGAGAASFGRAVTGAGDVDGDGLPDLLVVTQAGTAYVYRGAVTGFGRPGVAPYAITGGSTAAPATNVAAAGVGDVNADGYGDVAVTGGSPPVVDYYAGGPTGLTYLGSSSVMTGGASVSYTLTVAGAGDLDRNGYDDVLLGAPFAARDGGVGSANAFVAYGGRGGPGTPTAIGVPAPTVTAQYGASVAGVGDVDGDGWEDIAIADPTAQRVVVLRNTGGTPAPVATVAPLTTSSAGGFGATVVGAGDVNGDGLGDLLVNDTTLHTAWVVLGGTTLTTGTAPLLGFGLTASSVSVGPALAGAGDFNGDGIDDIAAGLATSTAPATGQVAIVRGATGAWLPAVPTTLRELSSTTVSSVAFGTALAAGR